MPLQSRETNELARIDELDALIFGVIVADTGTVARITVFFSAFAVLFRRLSIGAFLVVVCVVRIFDGTT